MMEHRAVVTVDRKSHRIAVPDHPLLHAARLDRARRRPGSSADEDNPQW
jgi:hypothetical protein